MSSFTIFYALVYNKNILEYAQIAQSEPKSMIPNVEGCSKPYFAYGERSEEVVTRGGADL